MSASSMRISASSSTTRSLACLAGCASVATVYPSAGTGTWSESDRHTPAVGRQRPLLGSCLKAPRDENPTGGEKEAALDCQPDERATGFPLPPWLLIARWLGGKSRFDFSERSATFVTPIRP